ncbi:hypothetical protein B0I35DRAFT_415536 [Stachybotrys elegans]|uniref:Uncharacterized protein n=1 Tax=Stachybotrys elegans TaxID=80388 RepID=A0A8K0SBY7_9HYPO|nr:hypothetical protein B0I35DRAFT_415536 [Stachybotrys elegans]
MAKSGHKKLSEGKDMIKTNSPRALLSEDGKEPGKIGVTMVPISTLESSFSISTGSGLNGYNDARLAATSLAIQYLEIPEGPLWNVVQGAGYAYHAHFARDIQSGVLSYRVIRSPDAHKAIAVSRQAIQDISASTTPIKKHLLKDAVSQIVVMFADHLATTPNATEQNFVLSVIRGLPLNWSKTFLKAPGESNVLVTCGKLMTKGMKNSFQGMGYKGHIRSLDNFGDEYGMAV